MTSALKGAGSPKRLVLKVSLPFVEQLAHLRFMGRRWTSRGSTPIRLAQARTSGHPLMAEGTGGCITMVRDACIPLRARARQRPT